MTDSDETSWINWFCKKPGNEFFVMVDEDFIHDKFNLMFLDMQKKNYSRALQVILDLKTGSASDGVLDSEAEVQEAEELYGLIHARFIVTDRGIELMYKKYVKGVFGKCPRVFCTCAFFGTNFPHMLFMVKPETRPKRSKVKFVARLYGFKIHPLAYRSETHKDSDEEADT
ncbi:casein kinase II subunit beta'-like [Drosophila obscura]|uniref:casein kinase II subunit beta'-like n=1 Tax=Drosophila obscura TaxID=7282 RepID=UPI001BB14BC1|nr:casein kinase II subunit beta'-like [Drosophila obscura]